MKERTFRNELYNNFGTM